MTERDAGHPDEAADDHADGTLPAEGENGPLAIDPEPHEIAYCQELEWEEEDRSES